MGWLALALALAESVNAAAHLARLDRPGAYWKTMRDQGDIAEFLRRQPGWFRVQVNEDDVPYNFGDFFGMGWGEYAQVTSQPICVNPGSAFTTSLPLVCSLAERTGAPLIGRPPVEKIFCGHFSSVIHRTWSNQWMPQSPSVPLA